MSLESVEHGGGQRNAKRLFDHDEIAVRHAERMHVAGMQWPPTLNGRHDAYPAEHLVRRVLVSGVFLCRNERGGGKKK